MKFVITIICALILSSCVSDFTAIDQAGDYTVPETNTEVPEINGDAGLESNDLFHCITYSKEVQDKYPDIDIVIMSAFSKWDLNWKITSNCNNKIIIGPIYNKDDKRSEALANASQATIENGSLITLHDIKLHKIVDMHPKDCNNEYLLVTVLTHEFGHMIGIDHNNNGVMVSNIYTCWLGAPTEEDLKNVSKEYMIN